MVELEGFQNEANTHSFLKKKNSPQSQIYRGAGPRWTSSFEDTQLRRYESRDAHEREARTTETTK